ncbi:hypothetical protein D7B24_000773 [Verticillium nonalfalfae]|uniref:FHA domain-containing protein n=1 Tax=Verticillium nonalfalfae TaxID=1051616 RepID=A0A3M9Y167_9PEZI|nr:uncharacterized protein D7B24_000773 [Verticillium nonalfalfae]RNJ54249.1 hypothetical protein D7B24_000773 [Verticillium nonalfalfae]
MGSDEGSRERPARSSRHRDEGDDRPRKSDRDAHRRRSRDRDLDRRRDRSRSREPRRKERRRSHTPDSSRRHRDRHRDGDGDRRRDRDADRGDRPRRRRSPDDAAGSNPKSESDRHTKRRASPSPPPPEPLRRRGPLPSQTDSFAVTTGEEAPQPKEQPNFGNSGALAAASNSVQQADGTSIVLKYHEPPEARKPPAKDDWKLFVFKGQDVLDTIGLSARSCWLVGREMAVVDLAAEHPSVSKQHAAIQFRFVEKRNEFGDRIGRVKPYLIDLESANGTELNGKKVAESRYVELRHKDMVKFGHSTREYVIMLAPK